jgi:HAD superfamily hydrolase (TIGR01509 family)
LSGVRAVAVDLYPDSPGRYLADAFHAVPPVADRAAFAAAVERIAEVEEARLVIPSTAIELEALAALAPALRARGIAVAVSAPPLLALAADKRRLYPALAAQGFPVLPLEDPRDAGAPWPLIGKPALGWGSRGVVVADSPAALAREWSGRLAEDYVWQRRLHPCGELSADFAIDFDGRASDPGVRRRVRTSGGFAVVTDTAEAPEAERLARRFAEMAAGMGGAGVFNLQFLEHEGRLHLSDVNPRFGTSAVHWRGTTRDPILHLCRAVDPGVEPLPRDPAPRTVRVLGELHVDDAPGPADAALRAVVFDLDDTLIPAKAWMVQKLERLWEAERTALPPRAQFLAEALRLVDEGPRATLLDALGARFGWPPPEVARLIEAYRAARPARCEPYPDVLPALATLRAKGYRLGLLTDNPPESQRHKLEVSGLAPRFDAVVFSREAGGDKPHPGAFAAMAAALGLAPKALAMAGDNPHRDGLGALAAGYGAAFVVSRAGTFFSFDREVVKSLPGAERLRFAGLRELAARLPATAPR